MVEAKEANLGLAEKYLGDVPEAKKVFAFLQSTDYNPLTSDQTKQVNEALSSAGTAIQEAAMKDGKPFFGDFASAWVYSNVVLKGGFNEYTEKINGRVAQLAFPYVVLQTFDGDFLDLLSSQWFSATLFTWAIIVASAVVTPEGSISGDPVGKALDSLPADARKSLDEGLDKVKEIFTEDAELTNSRAAMAAMGVFVVTALLF